MEKSLLRMPLLLRLQLREFPSAPRKDPTTKDVKRRQVAGPRPGSGELWLSIRRLWTTASAWDPCRQALNDKREKDRYVGGSVGVEAAGDLWFTGLTEDLTSRRPIDDDRVDVPRCRKSLNASCPPRLQGRGCTMLARAPATVSAPCL